MTLTPALIAPGVPFPGLSPAVGPAAGAATALRSATLSSPAPSAAGLRAEWIAVAIGGLLLAAVLLLWRRSASGTVTLVAVQGACLGVTALVLAASHGPAELTVAALLAVVKTLAIPLLLRRLARRLDVPKETAPLVNPTMGLLLAAVLVTVAYLVSRPVTAGGATPFTASVPVGIAVVLIGFLVLVTRRQALAQIVGFVTVDNGISATALLASGGMPLVVELGVLADVLLVVVILAILAGWIQDAFGTTELHELTELRD